MIKLNGTEINPTIFPDKTSQVWKLPEGCFEGKNYNIIWDFENESELIQLCQLVDLIKHGHVPKDINLYMPYLPYGRQDKTVSNETTFALHTFSKIIGSLGLDSITTLDAHSGVSCNIIESLHPTSEIRVALLKTNATSVAFPDRGACNRYSPLDVFKEYRNDGSIIIGHKVRDQLTGYITEYKIVGEPEGQDIIIIDDICDGGMTFKLMTEELLRRGANSVHLYVTHGIFSKGIRPLRASGIERIFTKNGEIEERAITMEELDLLQQTELSNL